MGGKKKRNQPKADSLSMSLGRIRRRKGMEWKAQEIRKRVLKASGLSSFECDSMSHEVLYRIGLFHETTTNKAICEALRIPVEVGCRRKRELEDLGLLVASDEERPCPITGAMAHFLTTNPAKFDELRKTVQTKLDL
jgi:hypothetical protein